MAYTKQTWENLPSQTTPINADRLTHIEDGIFNAAATADTAASNASSAISGLADKVDKVEGKGLSTNDFTDALKTKLDGIATGAEVNVQSDWNQSDNSADDYIKNKPTLGTSAYKNSTSVVTDSTDLVESGAVENIIGWGNENAISDEFEIGAVNAANQTGLTYAQLKSDNPYRMRIKNLIPLDDSVMYKISCDFDNYEIVAQPYDANGLSVIPSAPFNVWQSQPFKISGFSNVAVAMRKKDLSAITDSDLTNSGANIHHASVEESLAEKCDNSVIGTVEDGTTASQAYAVGSHFIRNGAFCTVTQAISSGGTLTEGTNYTAGDVASDIFGEVITPTAGANITLQSINCRRVGKNYFINAQIHNTANIANGATILTITHPLLAGLDTYGGTVAIDTNTGKIYSFIVRVANGGISLVYRNSEEALPDNTWLAITCNVVG